MKLLITVLAGVAAATISAAGQARSAATMVFSEPAVVAQLDSDQLKGQPARLSWSPDGSQFYLQTIDGAFGQAGAKLRHYTIDAQTGRRQDLQAEPEWASAYWSAKSAQAAPDGPAMKIELKSETRTEKTTSAPMGGDLARGGGSVATGSGAGDGIAAAYSRQTSLVHSMLFKGEIVGEFIKSVIVPGLTFGWGPAGSRVIAYADKNGRASSYSAPIYFRQ